MYFDGTTLAALLSDPAMAAASAPAISAAGPRYTSPLAVIEAAMELPDLGDEELTAFLDEQKIELRDMPPGRHLVEGSMATEGDLRDRLHAACAAYYETDMFVLPSGDAVVIQTEAAPTEAPQMDAPPAQ